MGTCFWRFSHLIMQRILYRVLRILLIPGLLLLAVAGQVRASEHNILILGDSISAAYGMSLEQGWVAQLARHLEEEKPEYTVINASISGETTAGGLRRLPLLLQDHHPVLVVIELGGNDGLRGFPLNSLAANLTRLTELSRQAGARVILVPMEIPPNYGARYTTGFRKSFQTVAEDTNSVLAPFILTNVATEPALMQEDGIHPTVEAQRQLLDNILPTVSQVLSE
jgi:acyl-CoA thioesterase-1